jgi:hypothetical protein
MYYAVVKTVKTLLSKRGDVEKDDVLWSAGFTGGVCPAAGFYYTHGKFRKVLLRIKTMFSII